MAICKYTHKQTHARTHAHASLDIRRDIRHIIWFNILIMLFNQIFAWIPVFRKVNILFFICIYFCICASQS